MSNWKLINQTYLYDGTFYGFLSLVFHCYVTKTLPQKIFPKNEYSYNFLDQTTIIETDFEKSQRVFQGIEKKLVILLFLILTMLFFPVKKRKSSIYSIIFAMVSN